MSITLKKLCTENGNPFKLTLIAGENSFRNMITWAYVCEDEYLIRYLHGSELVVTTCVQQQNNPDWLMSITRKISDHKAAGLIVNTGMFIKEVPQDVIDYCNEHDFPLLTMPWEIHTTDLIQTFCTRIIFEQQADVLHDGALKDAILQRDNEEEYREILGKYYDLEGTFKVILIYSRYIDDADGVRDADIEFRFVNEIRRFKTINHISGMKVGLVTHDNLEILVINNCPPDMYPEIQRMIRTVYKEAISTNTIFAGIGNAVTGLSQLAKSFRRAQTALKMAQFKEAPFVNFEDMGFYKILFSVRDTEILYNYADDLLAPLDAIDDDTHHYTELLKAYIDNDRSLERTAAELFIHRNTVNYQIQKIKQLLDNPLKTIDDLFPYKVALYIRDMQNREAK